MKYIIILLVIIYPTCYGQIVSYDFENNLSNNILYPNPVSNKLSLDLTKFSNDNVNIIITDISGKRIKI
jgi:hypothetical protein